MVASAPPILIAPQIDFDVTLGSLQRTGVDNPVWESIQINIPTEPVVANLIAPNVVDPQEPTATPVALGTMPDIKYFNTDVEARCPESILIPVPKKIILREWTEDTPNFELNVTPYEIDWSYSDVDYAISTSLADLYTNFTLSLEYRDRFNRRSAELWNLRCDPLELRGVTNSYKDVLDDRLDRGESTALRAESIIKELSDLESKKVTLGLGQAYENIVLDNHLSKQGMILEKTKAAVDASLAHYNATILCFNTQVNHYQELAEIYQGDIEYQTFRIQEAKGRLEVAQSAKQLNEAHIEFLVNEIEVQRGQVRLFQSQMELARKQLNAQLLQSEVRRLEIEGFSDLTQAQVSQVRQSIALQEAETQKARLNQLAPLTQRLLTEIDIAMNELLIAQDKFAADRDAFENTQTARAKLFAQFPKEAQAQEDRANRSFRLMQSRASLARVRSIVQSNQVIDAQERAQISHDTDVANAEVSATKAVEIATARSILATAKVRVQEALKEAELQAERSLAEADIQQTLTHELKVG